jgi:copper chaperone CopZ
VRQAGYVLVLCAGCSVTGSHTTSKPQVAPAAEAGEIAAASATPGSASASAAPSEIALEVRGMACPLCATNVRKSLERTPGVRAATVDLGAGVVRVSLKPGAAVDEAALKNAVAGAGFTARSLEAAP